MTSSILMRIRKTLVLLGDLPHEDAEISSDLTNGQVLSRLREITPDDVDYVADSTDESESTESSA